MPSAVDRTSASHYRWGEASEGWRLLDRADLAVIEERVPAGGAEQWHRHSRARQFFFILAGEATMETAQGDVVVGTGQGVEVEPGVSHRFTNVSSSEVRFLVISSPSTSDDREDAHR